MPELGENLSEREIDVLKCVADGSSNKEAALLLSISPYTVKTHLKNIYTKLGANSRTEAIRIGMEKGFLVFPNRDAKVNGVVVPPPASPNTAVAEVDSDSDKVAEPSSTDAPIAAGRLNWQFITLLSGLVLILAGAFVWQMVTSRNTPPEPVQYVVEEMGNKWSVVRMATEPTTEMVTSAVGLSIYQIGGVVDGELSDRVMVIDTVEKTISEATSKPTAVSHAASAVIYSEIYVIGGEDGTGEPSGVVEAFSPAQNGWRPITSLPRPLSRALAVSVESQNGLFVLGGHDGDTAVSSFYRYDLNEERWVEMPNLPVPRAAAAGGLLDGELYIFGGENETGVLASCSKFNLDEMSWSTCGSLNTPRAGAKAASFLGRLYLVGGHDSGGNTMPVVEIYDGQMESWQAVDLPAAATPIESWQGMGVTLVGSDIFILGGEINGRLSSDTYILSPFPNRIYLPATQSDN